MTDEFVTKMVDNGIWHIHDRRGGVMYLAAGQVRALLIDTGWGEGDLPARIKTLTPLPLFVVNTHGHRDHISGNGQFAEVYIHSILRLDFAMMKRILRIALPGILPRGTPNLANSFLMRFISAHGATTLAA